MNILLNTPLPVSAVAKKEFDNKVLMLFLSLLVGMVLTGLAYVNLTKYHIENSSLNTEELPKTAPQVYEYV